jgi:protein-disulfide isomerase
MEHHQKITLEETDGAVAPAESRKISPVGIIAGSIIVGALIVGASIIFSLNMASRKVADGLAAEAAQANTAALAGQQQQAAPAPQAPTGPVKISDRANEPVLGNQNAKVTVVEFGDFQCPFCKNFFQNTFSQIKTQYIDSGKIKYIFRHFPLTQIHVNAQIAAVAAECANQQGKFWQYHDILYTSGQSDGTGLDQASLEKYANTLGLNNGTFGFGKNKFNQCLEGNSTLKIVQADQAEGVKDGVTGTPTFYINGIQLVGAQPFTAFQTAIDAALKQ